MKIAIIGSGISGLTAAHYLHRHHDITVFEKNSYVGGHSNTVNVSDGDRLIPVDTGFIVFNDWTYPNFEALLHELDIQSVNSEMSFSVKCEQSNFEWCGKGIKGLSFNRSNWYRPRSYTILIDFFRFNRLSRDLISSAQVDLTLGEFLAEHRFSSSFINYYILPMGAAIWSSSMYDIYNYPAHSFLSFFNNHGLLNINHRPQWKTVIGGSREYVKKLIKPFKKDIILNSNIATIKRYNKKITIHFSDRDPGVFDHVIMACHSDQALAALNDPTADEIRTLNSITYQDNEAVLHTDTSLMPNSKKAWSSWNYLLPKDHTDKAKVTYYMNRLQQLDTHQDYFVTLNLTHRIAPEKIIKKISYQHPVFDHQAIQAQAYRPALNGNNNTWYCGAYWRNGFHEDGVWSALSTLEQFNQEVSNAQLHLQRAS